MLKRLCSLFLIVCCSLLIASWAVAEPAPVSPSKVSLQKNAYVMKNRTIALTPVLTPADATTTYTWYSSKKSVATVADGVVTGVKPGKATITVKTANNKKAFCTVTVTEVTMTGFEVSLADWQGDDCYYEGDEDYAEGFYEAVGHRMYPSIGSVAPADANQAIVWKSGNSKVASVSSKGVITCNKPGSTIVTATSKYGGYRISLPILTYANATYWDVDDCFDDPDEYDEDSCTTSAKYIYIKNGYLYVDMYFLNMYSFTIRRLSKQAMYLTLDCSNTDYEDYSYVGTYKPTLKGKIAPYHVGVATFKLGKIDGSKVWLDDADAYCEGYVYSKDIGADVKAIIPYVSGKSVHAPKIAHSSPRFAPRIAHNASRFAPRIARAAF